MMSVLKLGEIVIDEVKSLEPGQAEVFVETNTETKVVFEQKDFSIATSSTTTLLGVRVITGHRLGFTMTNATDEGSLRAAAREAQSIARLSPASEFHQIAPRQSAAQNWELFDPAIAGAAPKDIMNWAKYFVDRCTSVPHVSIDRAELSVTQTEWGVVNSNGVSHTARQSGASFYVMGMGRSGDEVTSFDYDGSQVTHQVDLEKEMAKVAGKFTESVTNSMGARKGESYKGPVLLHPAAVASLLAGVISANINGRRQQDGMSKWKDRLGHQLASSLLTVTENPLDESRPGGWTPYDREGVLTQNRILLDHGKLAAVTHNCFSAKRAGVASTGNASGGARGLPGIDVRNISFAAGRKSDRDLMSALNDGLVLKRFSGNSDPVSGGFSGVAKNSWWLKNGQRAFPVKEVMIAGNMFDLLEQVQELGKTVHREGASFDSPYILIDGLTVTAG